MRLSNVTSKSFNGFTALERVDKLLELWHYVGELEILAYTPQEFDLVKDRLHMKETLSYAIDLTPKKQ